MQRFDFLGRRIGREIQVSADTTDIQCLPYVAVGPQGQFVVTWTLTEDPNYTWNVIENPDDPAAARPGSGSHLSQVHAAVLDRPRSDAVPRIPGRQHPLPRKRFGRCLQRLRPVRHHLGVVRRSRRSDRHGTCWRQPRPSMSLGIYARQFRLPTAAEQLSPVLPVACAALRDAARLPRQQREQQRVRNHDLAVRPGIGPTRHRRRRRHDRRLPRIRARRLGQRRHGRRLLQAVLLSIPSGNPINWDLLPYFNVLGISDFSIYKSLIGDVQLSDGSSRFRISSCRRRPSRVCRGTSLAQQQRATLTMRSIKCCSARSIQQARRRRKPVLADRQPEPALPAASSRATRPAPGHSGKRRRFAPRRGQRRVVLAVGRRPDAGRGHDRVVLRQRRQFAPRRPESEDPDRDSPSSPRTRPLLGQAEGGSFFTQCDRVTSPTRLTGHDQRHQSHRASPDRQPRSCVAHGLRGHCGFDSSHLESNAGGHTGSRVQVREITPDEINSLIGTDWEIPGINPNNFNPVTPALWTIRDIEMPCTRLPSRARCTTSLSHSADSNVNPDSTLTAAGSTTINRQVDWATAAFDSRRQCSNGSRSVRASIGVLPGSQTRAGRERPRGLMSIGMEPDGDFTTLYTQQEMYSTTQTATSAGQRKHLLPPLRRDDRHRRTAGCGLER